MVKFNKSLLLDRLNVIGTRAGRLRHTVDIVSAGLTADGYDWLIKDYNYLKQSIDDMENALRELPEDKENEK